MPRVSNEKLLEAIIALQKRMDVVERENRLLRDRLNDHDRTMVRRDPYAGASIFDWFPLTLFR